MRVSPVKHTPKKSPAKKSAPKRIYRKRKKAGFSDTAYAVLLAALIIAAAAFVSAVFIAIHSTVKDEPPRITGNMPDLSPEKEFPEEPPVETRSLKGIPENAAHIEVPAAERAPAPVPEAAPVARTPARQTPPQSVPAQTAPPVKSPPSRPPAKPAEKPALVAVRPTAPPERPARSGTVVYVIDDAGNNLAELEPFLRYPGQLTIAVLPGLPHSAEAARRIRAAGKEVFLHQPMEALGGQPPGPGAIYTGMSESEIRDILARNIAEVGPVAGINNHQGSKVTMNEAAMETVLGFCRERGIPFLDSRTTADTVVPEVARRLGIKTAARNIFIDNDQEKKVMNGYISQGLEQARTRGSVIMIGHTWSPDLAPLLGELYAGLIEQGYTFSRASALINGGAN